MQRPETSKDMLEKCTKIGAIKRLEEIDIKKIKAILKISQSDIIQA